MTLDRELYALVLSLNGCGPKMLFVPRQQEVENLVLLLSFPPGD